MKGLEQRGYSGIPVLFRYLTADDVRYDRSTRFTQTFLNDAEAEQVWAIVDVIEKMALPFSTKDKTVKRVWVEDENGQVVKELDIATLA